MTQKKTKKGVVTLRPLAAESIFHLSRFFACLADLTSAQALEPSTLARVPRDRAWRLSACHSPPQGRHWRAPTTLPSRAGAGCHTSRARRSSWTLLARSTRRSGPVTCGPGYRAPTMWATPRSAT